MGPEPSSNLFIVYIVYYTAVKSVENGDHSFSTFFCMSCLPLAVKSYLLAALDCSYWARLVFDWY